MNRVCSLALLLCITLYSALAVGGAKNVLALLVQDNEETNPAKSVGDGPPPTIQESSFTLTDHPGNAFLKQRSLSLRSSMQGMSEQSDQDNSKRNSHDSSTHSGQEMLHLEEQLQKQHIRDRYFKQLNGQNLLHLVADQQGTAYDRHKKSFVDAEKRVHQAELDFLRKKTKPNLLKWEKVAQERTSHSKNAKNSKIVNHLIAKALKEDTKQVGPQWYNPEQYEKEKSLSTEDIQVQEHSEVSKSSGKSSGNSLKSQGQVKANDAPNQKEQGLKQRTHKQTWREIMKSYRNERVTPFFRQILNRVQKEGSGRNNQGQRNEGENHGPKQRTQKQMRLTNALKQLTSRLPGRRPKESTSQKHTERRRSFESRTQNGISKLR